VDFLDPNDFVLCLSVCFIRFQINNRPFLVMDNFRAPFQGLSQTLLHRTVSGGLYFVLQDWTYDMLSSTWQASRTDTRVIALAGLLAGALNGAILNSIASVKYQGWATAPKADQFAFVTTARRMYSSGGLEPFIKGTRATVARDAVFGVVYEVLRHSPVLMDGLHSLTSSGSPASSVTLPLSASAQFGLNLFAAVCATVVSAPFNYVRNIQYASQPNAPATSVTAELRRLIHEVRADAAPWQTLQRRLRLGWGSLRVGAGMAIGAKVYEVAQNIAI
jgi:hypothetical protein